MKKLLFFSAAMLGLSFGAAAQIGGPEENFPMQNTVYKGYVITLSNDTIRGYIRNTNLLDNQTEVLFYNDNNRPAVIADKTYTPNDLKGYKVAARKYDVVEFMHDKTQKKLFLNREVTGPITLYKFYNDKSDEGQARIRRNARLPEDKRTYKIDESTLTRDPYALKNGVLTDMSGTSWVMNYKKMMSEYVSDYPELAQKIANKEKGYGFINQLKHIYEYNDWAKANKK